jgi:hypothetical protein
MDTISWARRLAPTAAPSRFARNTRNTVGHSFYTVVYRASDASGNTRDASATVVVRPEDD